jgi:hypothetical protein
MTLDDQRAQLSELAAMYGATPQDLAQAERALMAAGGPAGKVQAQGELLPANSPAFTAVDRWTMLELWARAVPDQYAKLLRAPIIPDHVGRGPLPKRTARYDPTVRRHRHTSSGKFVPKPT